MEKVSSEEMQETIKMAFKGLVKAGISAADAMARFNANVSPAKNPGVRPLKDEADKVVKCRISMTQVHHAATLALRSLRFRLRTLWSG